MGLRILCPGCGTGFEVGEALAGRTLRCPKCQSVFKAPALPRETFIPDSPNNLFDRDQYFMNQKLLSLIERYTMLDENGIPLLYIERPVHYMRSCLSIFLFVFSIIAALIAGLIAGVIALAVIGNPVTEFSRIVAGAAGLVGGAIVLVMGLVLTAMVYPKRHINMYSDPEQQQLVLSVFQDQKFAFINHHFTVADESGIVVGNIRKNMLTNIFRRAWKVFDAAGETMVFLAREDSIIKSMLRRLFGPMLGLLRTNYVLLRPGSEEVLGEFNRKFTILDKYVLDLTADTHHEVDRRLAVALAVLLDTGERR